MWKKIGILFILTISMASLADSAEITCQWSGEICVISSITPVTQPNEAITIAGKPTNYINTETGNPSLYMMRPYLAYVPSRMFYIFPDARSFAMVSSSPKTTLVRDAFVNCPSLSQIYIQYANISNIPEGFAQSCTNLQSITITFVGLESIDKNAFKGLVNLKELNINDNKIACLPLTVFQTIPSITSLLIMTNRITAIDSGLFKNLPKLNYINLEYNLISYLPTLDFTGSAQNGFNFRLYGNPIYAIKPDFCNTFNLRPANVEDLFLVPQIKCLPGYQATAIIKKSNCQGSMAVSLQKCYSNWTLLANFGFLEHQSLEKLLNNSTMSMKFQVRLDLQNFYNFVLNV